MLARWTTAAALAAAVVACDGTSPSDDGDGPRLRATVGLAEPPAEGVDYIVQTALAPGGLQADVVFRARLDCTRVGAAATLEEGTVVLVLQLIQQGLCAPGEQGILVSSTITRIGEPPYDLRIEWWDENGLVEVIEEAPTGE